MGIFRISVLIRNGSASMKFLTKIPPLLNGRNTGSVEVGPPHKRKNPCFDLCEERYMNFQDQWIYWVQKKNRMVFDSSGLPAGEKKSGGSSAGRRPAKKKSGGFPAGRMQTKKNLVVF